MNVLVGLSGMKKLLKFSRSEEVTGRARLRGVVTIVLG
jgi:hypothetical protein